MAYVSERGKASDYLRELAAQIDDGTIDVWSLECGPTAGRLLNPGAEAFEVRLVGIIVDVASGVGAVLSDDYSTYYHDGRQVH